MERKWPPWSTILPFLLLNLIHFVSPDGGGETLDGTFPMVSASVLDFYPYNVTINHLSPRSVEVAWNCRGQSLHDKYEVTLKPLEASYRVIETVPYNTCYLLMDKLEPNTNYQVSVTSISGRVRKRSSSLIFRTFPDDDYLEEVIEDEDGKGPLTDGGDEELRRPSKDRLKLPRVRLVEISLVGMALILWAGAIVLFFHRWGKIRMLLPYQPDYKEMKRNNSVCANCSMTPGHQCCRVGPREFVAASSGVEVGVSAAPHISAACQFHHGQQMCTALSASKVDQAASVGCVPLTDAGCSPIRPRFNSFILYDLVALKEAGREAGTGGPGGMPRKSKSAEQLDHHGGASTPFMDECVEIDMGCTDF